eukprot:CAMPEP_0179432480 /NCGR_PEP_ID=MMETSP0799-20121207/17080_1 /TAXON_ID=46947 /ORGANISM="Geminigera cryophila, Strain CCMP2564" /LENGTH=67 /DNA_ID=CAMNT_0021209873 /DNA_START=42 /DNA_END=242 /DNA_ORIENTATION=-
MPPIGIADPIMVGAEPIMVGAIDMGMPCGIMVEDIDIGMPIPMVGGIDIGIPGMPCGIMPGKPMVGG